MTQEDKDLLLKDLSARLPYGVMVLEDINKEFDGGCISKLATITEIKGEKMFLTKNSLTPVTIEEIRPYLRPMSSMTEEEFREYTQNDTCTIYEEGVLNGQAVTSGEGVDWLNSHHFDYRGLIEKGLAFEAPEEMYNLNKQDYESKIITNRGLR